MLFLQKQPYRLDCIRYSEVSTDETWGKRLYLGAYGTVTDPSAQAVAAILAACEMSRF